MTAAGADNSTRGEKAVLVFTVVTKLCPATSYLSNKASSFVSISVPQYPRLSQPIALPSSVCVQPAWGMESVTRRFESSTCVMLLTSMLHTQPRWLDKYIFLDFSPVSSHTKCCLSGVGEAIFRDGCIYTNPSFSLSHTRTYTQNGEAKLGSGFLCLLSTSSVS